MKFRPTSVVVLLAAMLPSIVDASPLSLGADVRGRAVAINDANQVAGFLEFGPFLSLPRHAFFAADGEPIDIGTLGGTSSAAVAISENGQVVGWSYLAGGNESRAFLYRDGIMTDLGTLGGTFSEARVLNEAGAVVGSSKVAGDSADHAFLYSGGTMQDLGTLGGSRSDAGDINESNDVAGWAAIAGGVMHPFVWSAGVMTDLAASASRATGRASVSRWTRACRARREGSSSRFSS